MKLVRKLTTLVCVAVVAGTSMACAGDNADDLTGIPQYDGYSLLWHDEFNGNKLNTNDWNYEYHEPGWVNNELQKYVDSKENIYVKDGVLVIQPLQTKNKKTKAVEYTSGRVNLQKKHSFKYGKIEVCAKVPEGKGFLPAIWMMPDEESFYGQWPKCGEIDIMEVLGNSTKTLYSTLHYGEPHSEGQAKYLLKKGTFSNDYHVFGMEWEPGEIRFYVDGILYHTENDWFTKKPGFEETTYPAPFDQPFYLILNVAVGGNWPGNPDITTKFDERAAMYVDYVRIYQKDSYDENVSKPEKVVDYRTADATGNFIVNGNFEDEPLDGSVNWQFLKAGNGSGSAKIENNQLVVETKNCGELDYSIQIVEPNLPMIKGTKYRLSFDMKADKARTAIVSVTAPEVGWIRYFPDTKINVTTEMQHYSFEYTMTQADDPHARFEFNLGNQGSTATIYATNIRVEAIGEGDAVEEAACLPDGNYVYNGNFDIGADRFAHWELKAANSGVKYAVTNKDLVREAKFEVPAGLKAEDVLLVQENVKLGTNTEYILSFTAHADTPKAVEVKVADLTFKADVTKESKKFEYHFKTAAAISDKNITFCLGNAGTVYVDNVIVQEDALVLNGSFQADMTGYEVYAYTPTHVNYVVDTLNEDSAFCIDITNTGDMDWKIQLKQNNVQLVKGETYTLSFDAKSTIARTIMFALQRDGSSDNNWIPYSGTQYCELSQDFKTFTVTFTMKENTDLHTILSISMGAVKNKQIKTKHTVVIDNIKLVKVEK